MSAANIKSPILAWPEEAEDTLPMALWSAAEIAAATGGVASGDFLVSGIAIDSREVMPGDLFIALRGDAMDGHGFVEGALSRGASAAVVDRAIDGPHVLVDDTMRALKMLGAAARARAEANGAIIIGVTGSVGKTSVKEALFAALDRGNARSLGSAAHRSVKSYNNHVGVPLSLARMPARAKFGVFEMGMNHAGEIAALTRQVRPHIAIITAIAPAHIEMLGSEAAIAAAKAEIFDGLQALDGAPGGVAIIPADSAHYPALRAAALARGARVVSFGVAADADVRLLDVVAAPATGGGQGGSLLTIDMGDRRLCYTVGAAGQHWAINSLAVMAAVRVCQQFGAAADLGSAGLALAELPGMAGRGARMQIIANDGGSALLIDESYNANPASMRATLASLAQTPARRRIAVLGAMKELGDFAPALHAALADPIRAARVDFAVLVGPEMVALATELERQTRSGSGGALGKPLEFAHCADAGAAAAALAAHGVASGDAILVKGSNSIGLGSLVAELTVRAALKATEDRP